MLRDRGAMRVVFSPEVRRALANGSYRTMGNGALPVAVDQAGRIVEIAKSPGAPGLAAAAGGAGLGAAAVVAWPVVLAAGVATAAAISQQRWLEQAFAGLADTLDRIEARLRDDDLGRLDASDDLVELVAGLGFEQVPAQLREELAIARGDVDAIYFSRRRFVDRLKRSTEHHQTEYEEKTGERRAWVGDIVQQFGADSSAVGELVVFCSSDGHPCSARCGDSRDARCRWHADRSAGAPRWCPRHAARATTGTSNAA